MGHRRNPGNLERLLAALARGVGQAVKLSELARDVGGEAGPVANETLYGYMEALRDSNGNEVDAVVTLPGGKWGAFEVKLNPRDLDKAAASLRRFASSVDTSKHGEPAALGVITSTGYAGRREDGVHVVPIGSLGP